MRRTKNPSLCSKLIRDRFLNLIELDAEIASSRCKGCLRKLRKIRRFLMNAYAAIEAETDMAIFPRG